jgi:plastocyanin
MGGKMRKVLILLTMSMLALGLAVGSASGGGRSVKAENFDFDAKTVTVQKGDKVTWKNVEGRHTVTLKNGTFDKVISGDQTVSRKFKHSGTFRYYCRFHKSQGMRGKVIVE